MRVGRAQTWRLVQTFSFNNLVQLLPVRQLLNTNMQAAMNITAKYCHKEMEEYGACVALNPSTWQQECHQLKMKVGQCTSSHPVIQKIRQECSKEFVAFEKCLRENPDRPTSCSARVACFVNCAETVDISAMDVNPDPQPS